MRKYNELKIGDVVKINSPKRLSEIHLHKGCIRGHSYDDDNNVVAYALSVDGYCWTALVDEVEPTGEYVDPNKDMTDITVKVNQKGDIIKDL